VNRRASQNKTPIYHPLPYAANTRFKHKFRFLSVGNATPVVITRKQLLCSYLVGTATAMTCYRLIQGIKLNRIEMYSGNIGSSYQTIALTWLSNYGPSTEISDTSTSNASPAHFETTPPLQSLASFWSMTGSNESEAILNITAAQNAILDVWVDIVLMDGPGAAVSTSQSCSSGYFYVTYFDGPGSSSVFLPQSVVSIY
jgi:hypothetical protein